MLNSKILIKEKKSLKNARFNMYDTSSVFAAEMVRTSLSMPHCFLSEFSVYEVKR